MINIEELRSYLKLNYKASELHEIPCSWCGKPTFKRTDAILLNKTDRFYCGKGGDKGRCQANHRVELVRIRKEEEALNKELLKKRKDSEKNLERIRTLCKKYNVTMKHYTSLMDEQKGCCAICGKGGFTINGRKHDCLCVDHCHETGQIRGLLCWKCNLGIGFLKDSPNVAKKALDYLVKYHGLSEEEVEALGEEVEDESPSLRHPDTCVKLKRVPGNNWYMLRIIDNVTEADLGPIVDELGQTIVYYTLEDAHTGLDRVLKWETL